MIINPSGGPKTSCRMFEMLTAHLALDFGVELGRWPVSTGGDHRKSCRIAIDTGGSKADLYVPGSMS